MLGKLQHGHGKSLLTYAPVEQIPYEYKPALNGGLYTGESFAKGACWGNYPTKPETGNLIHVNLQSVSNHTPFSQYMYPGANWRPGNNTPELPGVADCQGFYMVQDDFEPKYNCYQRCFNIPKTPQCQQK